MNSLAFWSEDDEFGFKISKRDITAILKKCRNAFPYETGGILVGFYTDTHDCAIVTGISGAPQESKSGRTWFNRGVGGLQNWLERLWERNRYYYLGEWHFHPGGVPYPSKVDTVQMKMIANLPTYRCPEPILLIVGSESLLSLNVRVYVFPQNRDFIELNKRIE